MAKQLNLDEMLEILITIGHPHADGLRASLESIGAHMADQIAEEFNLDHDAPTFQGTAFAGTCAPFNLRDGQEWPELLTRYDSECDA